MVNETSGTHNTNRPPVLDITNLSIAVKRKGKLMKTLVSELNLYIHPGEMLGLVGESGSGKSVTAASILGMLPSNVVCSQGSIDVMGVDLLHASPAVLRKFRGPKIGAVFQELHSSFSPYRTLGRQLLDALREHESLSSHEAKQKIVSWLNQVGLPAERVYRSYSFQLSGGQLQRASIAACLMLSPSLVLADEPTTALDVLNGKLVLDLMSDLCKKQGCAMLLITHDLNDVLKRADRIAVMYGGRLLEIGPSEKIRKDPQHPYTRMMIQARPTLSESLEPLSAIPGEPGNVQEHGCPFAARCPHRVDTCLHDFSSLWRYQSDHHAVACPSHFTEKVQKEEPAFAHP